MIPKLPDPMLCLVFFLTPRGVVPTAVIADYVKRPFKRKKTGTYWTSWRRLSAGELGLVLRKEG